MTPPASGMQAIAAATFEGNPVDVDFGPGSGPGTSGGGGEGCGSWSGMPYIHKIAVALSSTWLLFFAFARDGIAISCVPNPQNLWSRVPLAFFIALLH